MANKIILSADGTCDIDETLLKRYNVQIFNFHIQIGDKSYIDKVELSREDIYNFWRNDGLLPKTAAITPADYEDYFRDWENAGYDVIHICIGSGISSAYQNCHITANEMKHIYPIDSACLSSGSGLLVIKAGEMIEQGMSAAEIQAKLLELREHLHTSFVLDTLDFMAAGGRCSSVLALGANLLMIKPGITVDNKNGGKMTVGKRYRGTMPNVLPKYIKDQLYGRENLDLDRIFITNSGSPREDVDIVREEIRKYADFKEIIESETSGTIACHCGPRTLGIIFLTK